MFNNQSIAMDLLMKYNAATAVVRLRIENLMLTLLLLSFSIWLYTRNPRFQVLRSLPPLFYNPTPGMDLFMEYNARTAVV